LGGAKGKHQNVRKVTEVVNVGLKNPTECGENQTNMKFPVPLLRLYRQNNCLIRQIQKHVTHVPTDDS
jgi:hypothetical protein